MNASNGKLTAITLAAGLVAATLFAADSATDGRHDAEAREVGRVQAHFDSVLTELIPRDNRWLTLGQQVGRGRLLAALAGYRDRGLFPHNYDVPDRMVPSFVDERTGVRCAIGQLRAAAGRDNIVRRVARENLHVYAASLATDTAFAAWLDDNGLTLSEASRIQPSYSWQVTIVKPVDDKWTNIDVGAAAGSVLVSGLNLVRNLDGHRTTLNAIGIATGVAALGFGGYTDNSRIVKHSIANLTMGAGLLSIAAHSIVAMRHARHQDAPANERISIGPWLPPMPTAANRSAGLTARIRF